MRLLGIDPWHLRNIRLKSACIQGSEAKDQRSLQACLKTLSYLGVFQS